MIDFYAAFEKLNEYRHAFWSDCGIHYPDSDTETNFLWIAAGARRTAPCRFD